MKESFVTSCRWTVYLKGLKLEMVNPLFWNGRKILDVGSGEKEMDKPSDAFPDATIIALDPEFGRQIKANNAHGKIKGIAEALPFGSNLFDLVLSYYSFPIYFSPDKFQEVIYEMLRVMKPLGEVRLFPINPYRDDETFNRLRLIIKKLKGNGFLVRCGEQTSSFPSSLLIISASEILQSSEAKNEALRILQ